MLQIGQNWRLFQRCSVLQPADGAITGQMAAPNEQYNFISILTNCIKKPSSYSFIKEITLSQLKVDCSCPTDVCGRGTQTIPAARVIF